MSLTRTEREFFHYCDTHEFIPAEILGEFKERLEREENTVALSVGLEKFRTDICPNCSAAGEYKWHFLGKQNHPDCGWSWYISPGPYLVKQLGDVFKIGLEAASYGYDDVDKQTGKKGGCFGAIGGFVGGMLISIAFRLPFALLMIPIQAVISLSQSKPEARGQTT